MAAVDTLARTAAKLGRDPARLKPIRFPLIPAKAGIQGCPAGTAFWKGLDPRFRGDERRKRHQGFPHLWFVTDPARTPDPARIVERLQRGAGVIYRAFGAPGALKTAKALAAIARKRGLTLLIGADEVLAAASGAHGIHLPQRMLGAARAIRRRHPNWIVTAAAHDRASILRADRLGLDAILVSPVFASASPSAGAQLGPTRFAALIRGVRTPVIALGGVNIKTAPRLLSTGAAGLAAVDGFRT